MIFSVYGFDDALSIVRLHAGFSVEGTRFGIQIAEQHDDHRDHHHGGGEERPPVTGPAAQTADGDQQRNHGHAEHQPRPGLAVGELGPDAEGADEHDHRQRERPADAGRVGAYVARRSSAPGTPRRATGTARRSARPPSRVYGLSTSVKRRCTLWSASTGTPRTSRERRAPQDRGQPRARRRSRRRPRRRQRGSLILPRHSIATTRRIMREQDCQQRQVEAGEHGRVPAGEGREHRAARGDQPHLVAVPDRPDGVEHGAAVVSAARRARPAGQRHQHADAEVEALEDEEADEQDRDERRTRTPGVP